MTEEILALSWTIFRFAIEAFFIGLGVVSLAFLVMLFIGFVSGTEPPTDNHFRGD